MTTIAELRSATWTAHQRLERKLDVKARFHDVATYRAHLEGMWGFYAELEPRLVEKLSDDLLPDYEARRKLPLLASDLMALGASADSLLSLPRCGAAPVCPDAAAAFGCAYVLEGATLGGRVLLPLAEQRLGLTPEHGASFLASYGQEITSMWQRFGAALDQWCCDSQRQARAKQAAVSTFDTLSDWLCESSS